MTARVLPLALVVGVFGLGQADKATALGPTLLVSITVSPSVASIAPGATQQFTATGTYSNLSTKNLTDAVTWSSSSGNATVSNAQGSQGLATGVSEGVATITATDAAALVSGTAALTVTPAVPTVPTDPVPTVPTDPVPTLPTDPVPTVPSVPATLVSVTVSPPAANVAVGAGEQFTATGTYSDLSTRDLTASVTWSSSSSATATVSDTGLATGISDGVATITATDPTALVSGTAALTVTPAPSIPVPAVLVSITVSPPAADVAAGAGEQFTATGTYSDLSTQDLTDSVTWSSSSSGTATVSDSPGSVGLATGDSEGVATITATDPAAVIAGAALLTVTPVASPASPAPSSPQLALTPTSGPRRSVVSASGAGFTPGASITVTYMSGLKNKRASTVLCRTTVASNGAYSCNGTIPRSGRSGKRGKHAIEAVSPDGTMGTSSFTIVPRRQRS